MNVNTGAIKELAELTEPEKKSGTFVPIRRDLTEVEKAKGQIDLYSPCGCGSGKKFKFCCHRSAQ